MSLLNYGYGLIISKTYKDVCNVLKAKSYCKYVLNEHIDNVKKVVECRYLLKLEYEHYVFSIGHGKLNTYSFDCVYLL